MAMMINQRLKEATSDQEDEDGLERIDLEALRRMDQKQGNPLKPYREEEASKPSDKYGIDNHNQKQPLIYHFRSLVDWLCCCGGSDE